MAFCGQCGTESSGGAFCTECGAAVGGPAGAQPAAFEPTTFEKKCDILADLWLNHKNDDEFEDFITYNDLGLPLAYAVSTGIVEMNPRIEGFINETFDEFLSGLEREDEGYDSLSDILG